MKKSQIKIASAHIPTLRNNQAKFHNNPMDSLGGVEDNRFGTDKKAGHKNNIPPWLSW